MQTARPAQNAWNNVIADGCNTGVVFRALFAVNAAALIACWAMSAERTILVQIFLDNAMLLEWGTLASLLAWCGARRLAQRQRWPVALQRLLCVLLPALVIGLIVGLLGTLDGLLGGAVQDGLFKAMALAAIGGAVLQYYFELRARAFSPALAEARLQALQARIRPHFLFNSLNAVLSLIRTQPRQAEETLEDLADLFRVLMQDARSLTSLEQEIELCKKYLAIEKIRLGDRLQVQWHVDGLADGALRRLQAPALLLQPLLENAVHYGVEPAAAPALITIVIARTLDRIELVITNPLHGAQPAPGGNHMALANIRERLTLLYDVEADLTASRLEGRFELRLRFPAVNLDTAS